QLYTVPETSDIGDYIEVDDSVKSQEELDNRYGFEKYIKTTFSIVKNECKSRVTMEVFTRKLIEREFPIHYDYLCQRLAAFCGNEKATVKVRREVDDVLYELRGKVIRKGDYLYPSGNNPIVVKMPNERKSQYISPDEFAVAMLRILNTYVGGIKRKALCDETARVYGFRSIRATLAGSLDKAVDILLKTGKIVETEEKLMIKQ
ncbi:MAG: hypothetical protein II149_04510, partial [Clostridia bacterium]|nr:hypothetical protein [Clostridia bacterium]